MSLTITGPFACTAPTTRQGVKLLNLMLRREQVRRAPALWGVSPDYDRAIDALKARMQ